MASITYAVVFNGQVLDGHQVFSVKAHMSKLLKADADKMQTLFSGKQVVLKRTPDKDQAIKIGTALKKIGADVKIKMIQAEAPAPATDRPASAGDGEGVSAGELTLAPNDGSPLVPPKPATPPPAIDVSNLVLAEPGDEPHATPREIAAPELDLSDYTVSENDGSPLVEPTFATVPEVEAPDFGLDEPGATLDTITEELEPVNPDISSLSLAEPGSDLIDDNDRPASPPPKAPDVSGLSLADL